MGGVALSGASRERKRAISLGRLSEGIDKVWLEGGGLWAPVWMAVEVLRVTGSDDSSWT